MSTTPDKPVQALNAHIAAYAGLVNALMDAGLITSDAIAAKLNGYANSMKSTQPFCALVLQAYATAISGDEQAAEKAIEKLH